MNFGRNKTPPEDNMALEAYGNTAIGTRRKVSAQEAEARQGKGIDIDMIDPDEIIRELQRIAHFKVVKKTTTFVGEIPNLKPVVTEEIRMGVRPWAVAALGYLNKVWPCIWMTTFEADTTKLRIRTAFHDIRKSMTPEDKRNYGVVLRMVRDLCLARCEDMKEGHKPLLLKVKREELNVGLTRGTATNRGK